MTTKIDSFKIKGKRKEHPMARKYPGRPSLEFTNTFQNFYTDLNEEEQQWLLQGTFVFEEQVVAPFFDSLQVGDVVGLGLVKGYEELDTIHPAAFQFEIIKIYDGEDRIRVKNATWKKYKGYEYTLSQEIDLCFEEVSWAFGCGFADILERDGKMFGVTEEVEYTVNVLTNESGSVGVTTTKTPIQGLPSGDVNENDSEEVVEEEAPDA